MKALFGYGTLFRLSRPRPSAQPSRAQTSSMPIRRVSQWTCRECLAKQQTKPEIPPLIAGIRVKAIKSFSMSTRRSQEGSKPPHTTTPTSADPNSTIEQQRNPESPQLATPTSLPSQTEEQRWQMSKQLSRMMDQILARASVASHHINVYTGTDYSGIEALRQKIIALEQEVRGGHQTVEIARSQHREAHAKQAAAQKEIVGLLERKTSWSPGDLERYMSLVRSEHADEQGVQVAKDGLTVAERALEDSRSLLERLERKQYHEEQIWSDTIRRNSTWVTFGLMGVNIILLLAQISIFEPYRRKKIVREVQKALDEKITQQTPLDVMRAVDEAIEPRGVHLEELEDSGAALTSDTPQVADGVVGDNPEIAQPNTITALPEFSPDGPLRNGSSSVWSDWIDQSWLNVQDLLSDRIIQVKKADLTVAHLEGAALGFATMGLLIALFRPR